ncbi:hypothetical protein [Sphingomonas sp.]|jgi:hypothetical protein|uniref:hypothetical protein n=1 Tax=Sphingomonas sp. TaxID=28214 RepID=UPI00356717C0
MRATALLALLLLAACSGKSPSGASVSEDKALDSAAASLEANSADANAAIIVDDDEGGNESDSGEQ